MKSPPSRRCLAVLLCLQPVLFRTSDVAYAQMLQDLGEPLAEAGRAPHRPLLTWDL